MSNYTAEQQAAINWITKDTGNLVIDAVPGSGKTKTLGGMVQAIPSNQRALAVVFNKKNADEFKARPEFQRPNVTVGTSHSQGFAVLRQIAPHWKVANGAEKTKEVAKRLAIPSHLYCFVSALVSHGKHWGIDCIGGFDRTDNQTWDDLIARYSLDQMVYKESKNIDDFDLDMMIAQGLEIAKRAIDLHVELAKTTRLIDYDDMVFLPPYWQCRPDTYDWVLRDEGQDVNVVQQLLDNLLLSPSGRFVAVGDRYQAIYLFAGADNAALDTLKTKYQAKELPLTTCFRCSVAVIDYVKELTGLQHITAAPNAPLGSVNRGIPFEEFIATAKDEIRPQDALISRNLKPLIEAWYSLIKLGIPCHIEGREIGKSLEKFVTRWKSVKTLAQLSDKLESYKEKQIAKLMASGKETEADGLSNKIDALLYIISNLPPQAGMPDLIAALDHLFADNERTFTLCTGHKSKGREFPKVYWLGRTAYQPSKYAKTQEQLDQERNLVWVMGTRAKLDLVEVFAPPPKQT